VNRVNQKALATRFDVSLWALKRHAAGHLSPVQRAALLSASRTPEIDLDALRTSESENLLAQLVAQRARLQHLAEFSLDVGDVKAAIGAESGIRDNLALVGKLLGQLVTRHEVRSTSLLVSPDWLRVRDRLIAALRPFPEASRAVGAALYEMEKAATDEITASVKPATIPPLSIEAKPATVPTIDGKVIPPPC
jgi:hypothetical protein